MSESKVIGSTSDSGAVAGGAVAGGVEPITLCGATPHLQHGFSKNDLFTDTGWDTKWLEYLIFKPTSDGVASSAGGAGSASVAIGAGGVAPTPMHGTTPPLPLGLLIFSESDLRTDTEWLEYLIRPYKPMIKLAPDEWHAGAIRFGYGCRDMDDCNIGKKVSYQTFSNALINCTYIGKIGKKAVQFKINYSVLCTSTHQWIVHVVIVKS